VGRAVTDASHRSNAQATGHVAPEVILLVLRGLADLDTAHAAYGHIRGCEACAKRARELYQERIARRGLRSRLASVLHVSLPEVPRLRVAYAVAAVLLVLGLMVPIVSGGGFLTRQDLDRKPFSAGIFGEAENAVARVYTATGAVDLAPEPEAFETPGMLHYPSPPGPSAAIVLPSADPRHRDVLIGSLSPHRPGGRLHLVRWSQRTNRFDFLVPADVADFIPQAILGGDQLIIRQLGVAESRDPNDLPRAIVWWRSREGDLSGLCVFAYDSRSDREPLRYMATLTNVGWSFPVDQSKTKINGITRVPGLARDRLVVYWILSEATIGKDVVPVSGNGAGIVVSLLDPFALKGASVTPFYALNPRVDAVWPVECGIGSWIIPRFLPDPGVGTKVTDTSVQVQVPGCFDAFVNGRTYRVDAGAGTCSDAGALDFLKQNMRGAALGLADRLCPHQIYRVEPQGTDRESLDLERQRLAALLKRDANEWSEAVRHLDPADLSPSYREHLYDMYVKPAAQQRPGFFDRLTAPLRDR